MARLDALPEKAIVDGFKGVIDFYLYGASTGRPIACARTWPRYIASHYPPTRQPVIDAFSYVNTLTATLPANIIDAYKAMAGYSALTWRDFMVRCYINGNRV